VVDGRGGPQFHGSRRDHRPGGAVCHPGPAQVSALGQRAGVRGEGRQEVAAAATRGDVDSHFIWTKKQGQVIHAPLPHACAGGESSMRRQWMATWKALQSSGAVSKFASHGLPTGLHACAGREVEGREK
jgi:hypothetical protein